jgi:acetyltransferase-like isoleucine patch superfamily enzyme/acyl carrier protein
MGRPYISNDGEITIGNDFHFTSRPAKSHLVSSGGAKIIIGDQVRISYGAAISAWREVTIGDDTRIGPFVVIMDSDFHVVGDRDRPAEPEPVHIGHRVTIGARVTILPGSAIGDGATIASGSVVSGQIPKGATVAGVPARAATNGTEKQATGLADLVMRVLGLSAPPAPSDGPNEIPQWDSLGSLKLLLALEDAYHLILGEEDMKAARSVGKLAEIVEAALTRRLATDGNLLQNGRP